MINFEDVKNAFSVLPSAESVRLVLPDEQYPERIQYSISKKNKTECPGKCCYEFRMADVADLVIITLRAVSIDALLDKARPIVEAALQFNNFSKSPSESHYPPCSTLDCQNAGYPTYKICNDCTQKSIPTCHSVGCKNSGYQGNVECSIC